MESTHFFHFIFAFHFQMIEFRIFCYVVIICIPHDHNHLYISNLQFMSSPLVYDIVCYKYLLTQLHVGRKYIVWMIESWWNWYLRKFMFIILRSEQNERLVVEDITDWIIVNQNLFFVKKSLNSYLEFVIKDMTALINSHDAILCHMGPVGSLKW